MTKPRLTAVRYAAVASTLALAVALGGTSYAAVKIGTKDLKPNAVTSAKIKNNTVTGADIKESTLGFVRNADTANHAVDADTVNGLTTGLVNGTLGTSPGRPFFVYTSAGLDVELRWTTTAGQLVATTNHEGATISTVAVSDSTPLVHEDDIENGSFGPSSGEFDVLAGDDGDIDQVTFTYFDPTGQVVQGTLTTDHSGSSVEPCSVGGYITSN